ncbi:MAG: NAD(P)/FAD-dependent oxidoreductase [Ramlibacter sp.]|nr:NAD(P)/FAD-dependent oxidoreductase [Ramlibacter sp.]
MQEVDAVLDVAIIGAGIGGVIALFYARRAGLQAAIFEKQDGVGGLWRELPAWQDIQISPADWALGDLLLEGPMQPQILANIQAWVEQFGLDEAIHLSTPVQRAREADGGWALDTPKGTFRARALVAMSGAHNRPFVPPVKRRNPQVEELHSSALRDPALLANRAVVVVGGGASAFDLIDLCLDRGAREVTWVHRGTKWFLPTRKSKPVAGSVRGFARLQASGMSAAQQSATIGGDMRSRYDKFGINDIAPERDFNVLHDQLIPGRFRMLEAYARLRRLHGTVEAIEGDEVVLSGGERLRADLLLWGTGYEVDLTYFESPEIASIRSPVQLAQRCGGIFRSLDAQNLFFPGVGLDGIGSAPFAYALMSRTIMSHLSGHAQLDMEPVPHKVNHFELVDYLAARDPHSFVPATWREHYRRLALETPDEVPYPIP